MTKISEKSTHLQDSWGNIKNFLLQMRKNTCSQIKFPEFFDRKKSFQNIKFLTFS